MPPLMQVKLLRVLQEREFERARHAHDQSKRAGLAATNRILRKATATASFAPTSFIVSTRVVRDAAAQGRREDIPPLAAYFVEKYAAKFNRKVSGVTVEAARA